MKIISYSLFGESNYDKNNRFVFDKYLLGVYFNARMNKLIYPDWQTEVQVDQRIYDKYVGYFEKISILFGAGSCLFVSDNILCMDMIERLAPIYYDHEYRPTHILCRDLDSVTTYKEAKAVNEWMQSGKGFHAINDNTAHGGLMGGMVGIDVDQFYKIFPEYSTFESLISEWNLRERGSDQHLMNQRLGLKAKNNLLTHSMPESDKKNKLWESDLTIRHIGSAGVNEMELLRFFQRFDDDQRYYDFEDEFNQICYWRR